MSHMSQHLQRMQIDEVSMHEVFSRIDSKCLSKAAFEKEMESLLKVRTYEKEPLGYLIVWSQPEESEEMIACIMDTTLNNSWSGKKLSDSRPHTAQLFRHDGATMVNFQSGEVQATAIHIAAKPGCPYVMEYHGTKHQSAVNLSWNWDVVVLVRSVDSESITIFSHALTQQGQAVRVAAPELCSEPQNTHPPHAARTLQHEGVEIEKNLKDAIREEVVRLNKQQSINWLQVAHIAALLMFALKFHRSK